jgi:cation:H+ antiporter
MNGILGSWLQFAVCALLIGYSGAKLARFGGIIGARAGWSGNWIGLILLSTVTSLPELATGISAAGFAGNPDIAAGDVFGSCAFNLLLLALLDGCYRKQQLYVAADSGHLLTAAFGIFLLSFCGIALVSGPRMVEFSMWQVGIASPLIIVLYVGCMRAISLQDKMHAREDAHLDDEKVSLRRAILMYCLSGLVVLAAGGRLPFVALRLCELMGWEESFFGTLFVAAATSLPELSVSWTALRMDQPNMAISNLLGSNLFNLVVLAIDDLAYREGPLLAQVSQTHVITVFAALSMGALAMAALSMKSRYRAVGMMSWHSILMIIFFALSNYGLFRSAIGNSA